MNNKYAKTFTLALCILFAFSAISFADIDEEKFRSQTDENHAYVKSTHNYTPRLVNIDKAGLTLEDFESGTYPPTGWTEYHTGLDELNESTTQAWSPTHSSLFNDVTGVDTSWFITPQILALDANAQLSFYQYENYGTWLVYHGIWISTASGDPTVGDFVEVQSLAAGIEDDWELVTVDLSAYSGQDVYVAFVYSGSNADEWYLDDIAIAPPAGDDIGVASIYPSSYPVSGASVTINAIVENFGLNVATGFDVDLSVDDGHTETFTYSGSLAAGTMDTVTFVNPWVPADTGDFVITAWTELTGDADPSNDTTSTAVTVFNAETFDFEEDFEDYTTVPNSIGWLGSSYIGFGSFYPSTTDDGLWRNRDFGNDPTLTNSARVNLYGATTNDGGWLITPPIDMTSGGPNDILSFDAAITPWTGTDSTGLNPEDTIYVVVSTDGITWDRSNIIDSWNSTSVVSPTGTHYEYDLSAWDNETGLHIGFLAIDDAGPNDKLFYIDNIFVGLPPVPAPFTEDFESFTTGTTGATANNWVNAGDDDFDWFADAGGTPSSTTGPAVDHTLGTAAGIYMFTESSTPNNPNYVANLVSPSIDLSPLTVPMMEFWYHMYGSSMGELHVDVYSGGMWDLDVMAPIVGQQQGDDTDPWLKKVVFLDAYAGNTVKVRFRGITGSSFYSDMAIDDVTIDEAPAVDMALVDLIGIPSSAIPGYTVNFDIALHNLGSATVSNDTVDVWQNGSVVSSYEIPTLNLNEADTLTASVTASATGADTIVVALRFLTGDVNALNDTLGFDFSIANVATAPLFEDFETGVVGSPGTLPADWTNEIDDDWDWYVDAGGTGSSGTGPNVDHTTNSDTGIYIYTEASSHVNQLFNVTSPFVDVSGLTAPAVSFWYHMVGTAVGELHIDVYDGSTWYLDVRTPYVGSQQAAQDDPWLMGAADLSGYGNIIKVRFRGITGSTFSSDMAVDDVSINELALIPEDIVATGFDMPYLTMIPLSQPTLLANIVAVGTFSNAGPTNTGDINLAVYDTLGVMVHSDMITGVTMPSFSDSMFSFDVDASGADAGVYNVAMYSSNFVDTVAANDTSWYMQTFGDQMAYDFGNWDYSVAYSSSDVRNRMGVRYTLTEDDTLKNVTIAVGTATGTDSFSVDLFTSVADTPSVLINRIYRGIFDSVGVGVVATFDAPNIPLAAGDYWLVYDVDNQATGTYALGADAQAQGAAAIERRFGWQIPGLAWSYWEDASNAIFGTLTPIIRIGLSGTSSGSGQNVLFYDDFESGTGQWTLEGSWGTTTSQSYSPTHSLTESPSGNYVANLNISATMVNGVDLSGPDVKGADLSFMGMGSIESGNFDYMYVEASNDGANWLTLDAIFGEPISPTFINFAYSLGAFIGDNDVRVRFRFFSDGGYEVDGMYIDDFMITTTSVDTVPPVIVHDGPDFYEGVPGDFARMADLIDVSGIEDAEIGYSVEGGAMQYVSPDTSMGATYYFTIPEQPAGSNVEYEITAEDTVGNVGTFPEIFKYISGTHLFYANPEVTFIRVMNTGTGLAVRFSVPAGEEAQLVTGLIRNYTDQSQAPNGQMLVHVWDDNAGLPGNDIITPFLVRPEANLVETSCMTRVDLRPYAAQLSNLTGDFHIGFTVPDTAVIHTYHVPTTAAGRSSVFNGTWAADAANDYHVRAVVVLDTLTSILGDDLLPAEFALSQNYPNPFNPSTTIKYALKTNVDVKLTIYNILGQEVRTLINGNMAAGYKEVVWNGLDNNNTQVSTGVYIYRIQAGDFVKSRKMIYMK